MCSLLLEPRRGESLGFTTLISAMNCIYTWQERRKVSLREVALQVAPSSSQGPGDQAVEALLGVQELESVIPHQQSLQERSLAEPAHEPHQAPALLEDFPGFLP